MKIKHKQLHKQLLAFLLVVTLGVMMSGVAPTTAWAKTKSKAKTTAAAGTAKVSGVALAPASMSLQPGQQQKFDTMTVLPVNAANKQFSLVSTNPAVATVDANGVVTAVSSGDTVVTMISNEGAFQAAAAIHVAIVHVNAITLNMANATLAIGQQLQLAATVLPANATDKGVHWISTNPNVAVVDQNGLITAKGAGDVSIHAESSDPSDICADMTVHVYNPNIPVGYVTCIGSMDLDPGEVRNMNAYPGPEEATNRGLYYISNNESIATVDGNGNIYAQNPGTTGVLAIASDGNGASGYCEVTVNGWQYDPFADSGAFGPPQ